MVDVVRKYIERFNGTLGEIKDLWGESKYRLGLYQHVVSRCFEWNLKCIEKGEKQAVPIDLTVLTGGIYDHYKDYKEHACSEWASASYKVIASVYKKKPLSQKELISLSHILRSFDFQRIKRLTGAFNSSIRDLTRVCPDSARLLKVLHSNFQFMEKAVDQAVAVHQPGSEEKEKTKEYLMCMLGIPLVKAFEEILKLEPNVVPQVSQYLKSLERSLMTLLGLVIAGFAAAQIPLFKKIMKAEHFTQKQLKDIRPLLAYKTKGPKIVNRMWQGYLLDAYEVTEAFDMPQLVEACEITFDRVALVKGANLPVTVFNTMITVAKQMDDHPEKREQIAGETKVEVEDYLQEHNNDTLYSEVIVCFINRAISSNSTLAGMNYRSIADEMVEEMSLPTPVGMSESEIDESITRTEERIGEMPKVVRMKKRKAHTGKEDTSDQADSENHGMMVANLI